MKRREFSAALVRGSLAAGALASGLPIAVAQGAGPVEGKDYVRISPPLPAPTGGKVEVYAFFSYACPHCNMFEPMLEAWARKLPADVVLHHVPVPFLMNAEGFQRMYYALEAMGLVDTLQRKVFAAVHIERINFDKPADMAAFVAKNGGNSAKFLELYNSFSVQTKARQATQMVQASKLDGVPSIGIQGRYMTSPSMAGSPERALAVADYLIQRARTNG